jgi:hypothetical protein
VLDRCPRHRARPNWFGCVAGVRTSRDEPSPDRVGCARDRESTDTVFIND